MKQIIYTVLALVLGVIPVFSYSPVPPDLPVGPDTALLPAILDSIRLYVYNEDSMEFLTDARDYKYDSYGYLIEEEYYRPEAYMRPEVNALFIYTYNENGNLIKRSSADWKWIHTYDADGNLAETIEYSWDSDINDWKGENRTVSTYDFKGNITEYIYYYFYCHGDSSCEWLNDYRRVFIHNNNGNLTEIIDYDWIIDDWKYEARKINTYDINGKLTEYYYYHWDSNINGWARRNRQKNNYDADGNLIEQIDYEWGWCWRPIGRKVNSYNTNGCPTGQLEYNWNFETWDWDITTLLEAYWSELGAVNTSKPHYLHFNMYPNPASGIINMDFEMNGYYSLDILSLNGKLIWSGKMEGSTHQIDLSSLVEGVYIITIRSEGFMTTRRIIKL